MVRNNLGYIFECKKDTRGNIGIKESFNFSYRDDIQKISAIFGIDMQGNIVCPAYIDKASGLVSLGSLVSKDTLGSDVEKFVRSNRATYSLSNVTYLICSVEAKISKTTFNWVDDSTKINFYVPRASMSLGKLMNNSNEGWGIVCDIAASSGKLNTFHVSEGVLSAYKQLVIPQLKDIVVGDKKDYLEGRLSRYI